jgi:hypothetical protein
MAAAAGTAESGDIRAGAGADHDVGRAALRTRNVDGALKPEPQANQLVAHAAASVSCQLRDVSTPDLLP